MLPSGRLALFSILASLTMSPAAQPDSPGLRSKACETLPLGSIKPSGWLQRQLEIQASGLGGHLDEFWPDVRDSAWVGGKAEGWERGPYWLDGFIPLAIHLQDETLTARAKRWVDHILENPQPDGWLGPVPGNPSQSSRLSQYDAWPRFIVLKALTQWQEATGDPRVIPVMQRFLKRLDTLLDEKPLAEWARVRWADLNVSIYWLYDRSPEPWLLNLAAKVHSQGLDWSGLAHAYPYAKPVDNARLKAYQQESGGVWLNDHFGATHGVNIGMGIKAPGVWFRQSGAAGDREATYKLLAALDKYHGQATGLFTCDEHVAGQNPSQGSELCTVVEAMFSLENLLQMFPDVKLADRLESLAFNALPATFTDDMWAHQYVQQANQAVCRQSPERIYMNNGPDANLFGLEPNFGCCLANMHQGWPKLVSHLWMKRGDSLVALVYAPCTVKARIASADVKVDVRTDYPFKEEVEIRVSSSGPAEFPLHLRIPGWVKNATLSGDGMKPRKADGGEFLFVKRDWNGEHRLTLKLPMPLRAERRFHKSVAIHRGPLVFALDVGEDWRKLRDRVPTADWEVHPSTPWNYALALNTRTPGKSLQLETRDLGKVPFSSQNPPLRLRAKARLLPEWQLEKNAAAPPPVSPVSSSEPLVDVSLVPYACTKLRITEIPVLK